MKKIVVCLMALMALTSCNNGNKERIKDAPVLIVSTFERGKSGFFQGNQTIMAVISLGYRAEEPNRPERKNLDDIVKIF